MFAARRTRRSVTLSAVLGAFIAVTACASGNNPPAANHVLVVDKSFDMKTADPQREFEVSGGIVAKALYSTLLTFKGADSATPVPSVVKHKVGCRVCRGRLQRTALVRVRADLDVRVVSR